MIDLRALGACAEALDRLARRIAAEIRRAAKVSHG